MMGRWSFAPHYLQLAYAGMLCIPAAASLALRNLTVSIPDGASNHGDPNLLCTAPAKWTDVLTFFAGNYIAHVATVVSMPGESTRSIIRVALASLLFPTSGIARGILVIMTFAALGKTDLHKAARARALCMFVRSRDWKPEPGDVVGHAILETVGGEGDDAGSDNAVVVRYLDGPWGTLTTEDDTTACVKNGTTVNGSHRLPEGYELAHVDPDADFEEDSSNPTEISSSYNLLGSLAAVAQAFYALLTLYETKGDQLARYGYAAFGLTVAPFVVMSIVNLVANISAPNYSATFMIESSVMEEARKRKDFHVNGTVGKLKEAADSQLKSLHPNRVWVDSVTFEKDPESGQLTVRIQSPNTPTDQTLSVIAEGHAMELSTQAKVPDSDIEVQEQDHLVLQDETVPDHATAGKRPHRVLYIPSCGQIKRASATKYSHIIKNTRETEGIKVQVEPLSGYKVTPLFSILLSCLPLIIVGAVSRFKPGDSTPAERGWTMAWLATSTVMGVFLGWTSNPADSDEIKNHTQTYALVGYLIIFATPAIGGFITVGQMVYQYGTCVKLP